MKASETYVKFTNALTGNCGYRPGDRILAAVSGGPDSVCMLLMLKRFLPGGALGAAHFNHCLRGEESDRDESFTKKLAESLEVPFYSGSFDIDRASIDEGIGIEECARKYRYDFLRRTAALNGYDLISVAHNVDDNAETILMHIFRGCSVDGLRGLRYRADNIIRPLLDIDRREIIDFLRDEGQQYVTDSSNADNSFMRNRVRNEIIPYISEKLGYSIGPVLVRQTPVAAAESDHLESCASAFVSENVKYTENGVVLLDSEKFCELDKAIGRRVIRHVISYVKDAGGNSFYGGRKDIDSGSVERAIDLIFSGSKGPEVQIGRGIKARLTHSGALFYFDHEGKALSGCGNTLQDKANVDIRELSPEEACQLRDNNGFVSGGQTVFFDKDKYIAIIKTGGGEEPYLRLVMPGDTIVPFGMKGKKKIQKLLIDRKVPFEERKKIRVLATGSEVLWIPGICSSELLRITDETDTVLQITIQEDNSKWEN